MAHQLSPARDCQGRTIEAGDVVEVTKPDGRTVNVVVEAAVQLHDTVWIKGTAHFQQPQRDVFIIGKPPAPKEQP
ncbi:MAG TPA: hypothetical protein VKX16_10310 [Chloroflexota bacterium]|nr:hypothetical protein [Chloroflexota bacterium]